VYVAFFALTGAGLRIGVLADLWPWVLLLVGLRIVGLRYGMLWAGRHSGVPPALARFGWLGLVSQAGVALGLAQLARRAFPQWGVSLETLIVAMIGVHEMAGPICFRTALVRAGEVTEETPDAEAPVDGGTVVAARVGGL
jgi:Kef-type K+ transport system membrane component KefB